MAAKASKGTQSAVNFRTAIGDAEHLQWKDGLQAVAASEGGGQIIATVAKNVLGSVNIDTDCRMAHPTAARWDYVIGYQRAGRAVAHFVEVHTAETSEVSKMRKKLAWLHDFLARDAQQPLAKLTREIHWVASGRINIPKHVPQYRILTTTLRKLGLKGPVKHLTLV